MKSLSLVLTLLAVSCASKTPPVVKVESLPGHHLTRSESGAVRFTEKIKAYPLGRYADPNQRGIMHEAHTIYRVETTPKWNLAGRGRPAQPVPSNAAHEGLSRNELLVELNRQREATKAVIQSGESVSTRLGDLASTLQRNQQMLAEQNERIRKELQTTRERVETLEQKVSEKPAPEPSPSLEEDPW